MAGFLNADGHPVAPRALFRLHRGTYKFERGARSNALITFASDKLGVLHWR